MPEFIKQRGWRRLLLAATYSARGLAATWRHEAAFRQEVVLGIAMLVASIWLAPSPGYAVAMNGVVLLVWCIELLNSAIEALADAISTDHHPLLGRAKDIGSAAVLISLLLAVAVWATAIYVRFWG